jgi:trigger factor
MKVTQEKLPASQIGLEIEISPEMSKKAFEQVIQEFTRSANIPGFRKGKVPRQVLLQRFGSSRVKAAALEDLIQKGIQQALEQEKIEAIGNYQLRSSFDDLVSQFEPGAAITFSAAVDVQPEVNLKQYTGFNLKAEQATYDASRVDEMLEERRKELATLIPVEGRSAQMGDVAVVDFSGRIVAEDEAEGEPTPIPGGQAEDFQVELSEGRFIPGFIDGIVGMNAGETKEISVQFPEGYPQADLSGKPAIFTITLKELKEKELPALDDDFAQEVSEFQTLEELRASLEKNFQESADKKTANNKEQALLGELINHIEVDLPATLVDREVDYMLTQTAIELQNQGLDVRRFFTPETLPGFRERSRPEAINRIKRTMALGEIAKKESIQLDPAAVEARIKEVLEQYSDQDIDQARLRTVIEEDLLKEKIVAWLEEHSTIELVPEGSLAPEKADSEAVEEAETATPEATEESTEA